MARTRMLEEELAKTDARILRVFGSLGDLLRPSTVARHLGLRPREGMDKKQSDALNYNLARNRMRALVKKGLLVKEGIWYMLPDARTVGFSPATHPVHRTTDKGRATFQAAEEFLAKLREIEGLDKAIFRLVPSGESVLEGMNVTTLLGQLRKIMPELDSVCEIRTKDTGEYGEEGRVLQITRIRRTDLEDRCGT